MQIDPLTGITGFDPAVAEISLQVIIEVVQVIGPLGQVSTNYLLIDLRELGCVNASVA